MTKKQPSSGPNLFLLIAVFLLSLSWIWQMNSAGEDLSYKDVRQLITQERVEYIAVQDNTLTLRLTKFDAVRQGEVPVNASATMTLADGTVIKTATHTATLRGMLEKINDTYQSFNESQLAAVEKMIEANPVMKKWNVDNLYYKEDGVIEIPIPNNE